MSINIQNNIKSGTLLSGNRGFTIVELLIVIVVIGILAAIIIVAYQGVTNKAKNSQYQTDAVAIIKGIEIVNSDTGSYPTGTDSATLKASINSSPVYDLASNLGINRVTAAPADNAAVTTTLKSVANVRTYSVWTCAGGANVYYPLATGTVYGTAKAGSGC